MRDTPSIRMRHLNKIEGKDLTRLNPTDFAYLLRVLLYAEANRRDPSSTAEHLFQTFVENTLAIHSDNAALEGAAHTAKSLSERLAGSGKIQGQLESQHSLQLERLPAL